MNTSRLNHIVNPFPEKYGDSTEFSGQGGRSGLNYDYNNERNKWILEGIHDSYINYGSFPEIGQELLISGPLTKNSNSITLSDAMAYAALYPQNAIVIKLEQPKIIGFPITQFDFSPISKEQMIIVLQEVYNFISQDLSGTSLFTVSDISLYKEGGELNYLKLPSIPYQSTHSRTTSIRKSFKLNPNETLLGGPLEPAENISNKIQTKQRDGLDFLDWSKNITPRDAQAVTYYNARDGFIYYCFRSRVRNVKEYDKSSQNLTDYKLRKKIFLKKALSKILAFSEVDYVPISLRNSTINQMEFFTKYGDSNRPPAPDGLSVWLLACRISLSNIENLSNVVASSDIKDEKLGTPAGKGNKKQNKSNTNISKVPYESYLSPYQICKKILENTSANKAVLYQIKNLDPAILQTEKVLRNYSNQIANAKVSPSMLSGFNLQNSIENFGLLKQAIDNFMTMNALNKENYDMIEFRFSNDFKIKYVFYNGRLILGGLGISRTSLLKDNTSANAFVDLTSTSLAYFYYSTELSTFNGRKDIPPWTTFISRYTYPSLDTNSIFKSRLVTTSSNLEVTSLKDISKLMEDGDRKQSASQKMAAAAGDTKLFPSEKDVRSIRARKDFISAKELENQVRSAIGSCDTGLSSALSQAFQIYDLVTSRADKKAIIARMLRKSMDGILFLQKKYANELISKDTEKILSGETAFEFGKLRIDSRNIELYINRPDFLGQEIERELLRQVSCIFDLIGDGINTLVLDPLIDEPGPLKSLVREVVNETDKASKAYSIDFLRYKITTRDTQKAWRLAIERIIESFLKQMILDIFKDVITALLGCGPEDKEDKESQNKNLFLEAYGELRINLLLENSDKQIKLLEICDKLDIKNTVLTGENLDIIEVSPPSEEQLFQLHEDISDCCTKTEAEGLLEGNAPRDLVIDLVDMITDNIDVSEYNNFLTSEQKTILIQASTENNFDFADPSSVVFTKLARNAGLKFTEDRKAQGIDDNSVIRLKMSADSLSGGDTRYATLGFTEEKLREYFREIGKALGPDSLPSSPLVPEDAFCDPKILAARGLDGIGISLEQLNLEVQQGTEAELEKLIDLCELFNGAFDGFDMKFFEKWEEGLPLAEGYRLLLEKIAFLSRLFQSLAFDVLGFSADAGDAPVTRARESIENTQLYSAMTTNFGTQTLVPKVKMVPNRTDQDKDDVFQWYMTAGVDQTFIVNFEIRGNNVFITGRRPAIVDGEDSFIDESLGVFELNTDNGMGLNKGTLHNYIKGDGLLFPIFDLFLDDYDTEIAETINSLLGTIIPFHELLRSRFPLAIANKSSITNLATSFYISYSDRIRPLTQALSKPLFETNGDPCVLTKQQRVAIACLNSLQTRINNFVLNTAIYYSGSGWGFDTPDTIDMLAAYLAKKFEFEMTEKKLFDIYLKSMDDVDRTFSRGSVNQAGVLFDISTETSLRDKFQSTIKLCLQTIFRNIPSSGYFGVTGTKPYDNQEMDNRAVDLLNFIRTGEFTPKQGEQVPFSAEKSLGGFTDGQFNRPAVAPSVELLQQAGTYDQADGELIWTTMHGYYYVPIPLLNGLTLIFLDYAVNVQSRLPSFKFFSEKRVANADDTLITAINPENVTAFSDRFSGYPLTVGGVTYFTDEEVMRDIKLYERQFEDYSRYLDILKTPLFTEENGSYNFLSYKAGTQTYTILGNLPRDNEFRSLQLGILEFTNPKAKFNDDGNGRDFFNPLYGMYMPIFEQLSTEEQNFWIKEALRYSYTDDQLKSWTALGGEQGTPEQRANPNLQKAFAFYERKRILEIALPGDENNQRSDSTFLDVYKRAGFTNFNDNPYAPVGERTRDGKLKIKEWVQKERLEALEQNQSNEDLISGVYRSYATVNKESNLALINYPQPGQWEIRRGKLVLNDDYLRRGGGPPPYNTQGFQTVSLEDDMLAFFRTYETRAREGRGANLRTNDLKKVAINHLYYILSSLTQRNIQNINPDDEQSSINKLKRHLGI